MTDEAKTYPDQAPARLVRPWYAWEVSAGQLFRTEEEARDTPPEQEQVMEVMQREPSAPRLLRQYRFEDDGSWCGRAEYVR